MGQFSNSFPKHFSYLCEYTIRCVLSCSFCEYPFILHCLHCSPSCFDPDSLLLAYLWLGLSSIDCISATKTFSSSKTSSRKPYTSSKQQERNKHSVEITIKLSHDKVWFVMSRRKERPVHEPCPVHAMSNVAFCRIYWLSVYLDMTTSYEGPALFVSLKPPRRPILASTINSLTTTFLRSMGLHEFTAHSTRGSAATALILLGVEPTRCL